MLENFVLRWFITDRHTHHWTIDIFRFFLQVKTKIKLFEVFFKTVDYLNLSNNIKLYSWNGLTKHYFANMKNLFRNVNILLKVIGIWYKAAGLYRINVIKQKKMWFRLSSIENTCVKKLTCGFLIGGVEIQTVLFFQCVSNKTNITRPA